MIINNHLKFHTKEELVSRCAELCNCAQEFFNMGESSNVHSEDFDFRLEAISYMVACYLAQNTVEGSGGVDWDIVHEELMGKRKYYNDWYNIIRKIVDRMEYVFPRNAVPF